MMHHTVVVPGRRMLPPPPGPEYFRARCDCGWYGSPRQTELKAQDDATKHVRDCAA